MIRTLINEHRKAVHDHQASVADDVYRSVQAEEESLKYENRGKKRLHDRNESIKTEKTSKALILMGREESRNNNPIIQESRQQNYTNE